MKKKLIYIFVWIYAVFIGLFAFDTPIFSLGFLMHQIPFLILVLINIIVMKKPKIAAYLYLIMFLVTLLFFKTYVDVVAFLLISLPLLIFGIVFLKKKTEIKL